MIYYFIVIAVIALDRAVKFWTTSHLYPGESIPVFENIFHLTYVQNQGAAFSMMEGQWIVLILLPAVVLAIGLVLIFLKKSKWSAALLTGVALICGGGIGNLIDRTGQGYVVDLFDFRVFPVFNVADIAICVGCGLLLLDILILDRKRNGKNE